MKLAVMQPYFFPYIGYWQLIAAVDTFIIYDDVNYIKQGWINRNNIIGSNSNQLISLQVIGASSFKFINEINVGNNSQKILRTIEQTYKKAPYFQLDYIDQCIAARCEIARRYRKALTEVGGIRLLPCCAEGEENYSYFPILVEGEYPLSRDELYAKLREQEIYARRYFYPLVSDFPMYRGLPSAAVKNLPVAKQVAEQILCLPIYPELAEQDQLRIIQLITSA